MTKKNIVQPFLLARAKYQYDSREMQILMFIISSFQREYKQQLETKDWLPMDKDLFGNVEFKNIRLEDMGCTNNNHLHYKEALFKLAAEKSIRITTKKYDTIAHLIEDVKYYHGKAIVDFKINSHLVPFFLSLAHGHTYIDLITIFKLSPIHQRIYMLMSSHDDKGKVMIHAKNLREMLGLENKYPQFRSFKNRIIESAKKELDMLFSSMESKLKFYYEEDKRSNDDWDRMLTFKVVSLYNENRDKELTYEIEAIGTSFIGKFIALVYNNNPGLLSRYITHIGKLNQESRTKLNLRLFQLNNEFMGKNQTLLNNEDLQKITSTILKKEFGYLNQSDTWENRKK